MDRNDDQKLESMLRSRRTQAASPDLAARIMGKAQITPQIQRFFLWQAFRQMFLAVTLIVGMLLGFSTAPQIASNADLSSASAQSFLADDEGLL